MKKLILLLSIALISIPFIGCKDESDDDVSIYNEWVLNEGDGDVWFLEITKTTATHYDYMGDSYDEGDDCYDIWSVPISVSNNTITVNDEGETYTLSYSIKGDILTISEEFEGETFTQEWKKEEFNQASFSTKECTFKRPSQSKKWSK